MTDVPFPILRLPQRAMQISLEQMSLVEHLSLSFVSINTKQLLSVLEKNYDFAFITMSSPISFVLIPKTRTFPAFNFYLKPDQSIVEIRNFAGEKTLEFSSAGFTEKQWIEHFSSVFIQNKNVILEFPNLLERKIEDVYESIKDLNIVGMDIQTFDIQEYPLVKLFPALDRLTVDQVPICTSILVQNFSSFEAGQVTLDSILASNCINFTIFENSLSNKDFNLFMKHCIRGSNRHLRYLYTQSYRESEDIFEAVFFQGISYIETMDKSDEYGIYKMFEIRRHDGTKACVNITDGCFSFSVI